MVTASVINSADVMGRRCGGHLSPQGPKQTFQRGRRGGRSAGIPTASILAPPLPGNGLERVTAPL